VSFGFATWQEYITNSSLLVNSYRQFLKSLVSDVKSIQPTNEQLLPTIKDEGPSGYFSCRMLIIQRLLNVHAEVVYVTTVKQ